MQDRDSEGRRDAHAVRQRAMVAMVVVRRMGDRQIRPDVADQPLQRPDKGSVRYQRPVRKVEKVRCHAEQPGRRRSFLAACADE